MLHFQTLRLSFLEKLREEGKDGSSCRSEGSGGLSCALCFLGSGGPGGPSWGLGGLGRTRACPANEEMRPFCWEFYVNEE